MRYMFNNIPCIHEQHSKQTCQGKLVDRAQEKGILSRNLVKKTCQGKLVTEKLVTEKLVKEILAIDEPGGNRNLKININAQQKIRKRAITKI